MESRLRRVRVTSTRVVYENRWMRGHEDRLEREDGSPGLYGWIEKGPAAIVVPIEDGHVWLVEQYRHPVGRRGPRTRTRASGAGGSERGLVVRQFSVASRVERDSRCRVGRGLAFV